MDLRFLFKEGQEHFRNVLRELIYKTHPEVFDQLDFYCDAHFSDPLLFGYFNQMKGLSIEQIQQAFLNEGSGQIFSDEFGVAFIPNSGYFITSGVNAQFKYNAPGKTLIPNTGKEGALNFVPSLFLEAHNNIEVCLYSNPYYSYCLSINGVPLLDPCVRDMPNQTPKYIGHINEAFQLIRRFCPEEYEMYVQSTRRIVLYEKENIRSFVTRNVHGTIFISVDAASNTPFFIEELIHQCSHNVFDAIMAQVRDYLKILPTTPMSALTGNERDIRDIFGAYHGVYTVSTGVNSILPMIQSGELDESMQVELLARLAIKKPRFRTGIQQLDFDAVFTEKGKEVYHFLDQRCYGQIEQHPDIFNAFDFSNQRTVFSFQRFMEANQLTGASEGVS